MPILDKDTGEGKRVKVKTPSTFFLKKGVPANSSKNRFFGFLENFVLSNYDDTDTTISYCKSLVQCKYFSQYLK